MMKNIAVLGLGKVGTLVATLLSERFEVTGFDKNPPHYDYKHPFNTETLDLSDTSKIETTLKGFDMVVSALPYFLNKPIAKFAHDFGLHYFD